MDHNHYGTGATNRRLAELLALYQQFYGAGLYVNDMSLPKGGLFDISGHWVPAHQSHRRGIDVDMHIRDTKGILVKDRLLKINSKYDQRLFRHVVDEGNHLHIYF